MEHSAPPPDTYDPDLAAALCLRIDEGEDLPAACEYPGMPTRGAVLRWADEVPEFADKLAASRRRCAEMMIEDLVHRCEGEGLAPDLLPSNPGQQISRDRIVFTARRMLLGIYDPGRFAPAGSRAAQEPPSAVAAAQRDERAAELGDFMKRFTDVIRKGDFIAAVRAEVQERNEPRLTGLRRRGPALRAARAATKAAEEAPAPDVADAARQAFRDELISMSITAEEIEALLQLAEEEDFFDAEHLLEVAPAFRPKPYIPQRTL